MIVAGLCSERARLARMGKAYSPDAPRPPQNPDLHPFHSDVGRLVRRSDAGLCCDPFPVPVRPQPDGLCDWPADDSLAARSWRRGPDRGPARRPDQRRLARRDWPGHLCHWVVLPVSPRPARRQFRYRLAHGHLRPGLRSLSISQTTERSSAPLPSRVPAQPVECSPRRDFSARRRARSRSVSRSISRVFRVAPTLLFTASIAALVAAVISLLRLNVSPPAASRFTSLSSTRPEEGLPSAVWLS